MSIGSETLRTDTRRFSVQVARENVRRPVVIGALALLGLAAVLAWIGQVTPAVLLLWAVLTGVAIVRPTAGLYLLALVTPWEEFFYFAYTGGTQLVFILAPYAPWLETATILGTRFKMYEPILLGLLIGLVLQSRGWFSRNLTGLQDLPDLTRPRLDRLTWILVLYVTSGLLSIVFSPPPSLRSSLNVILFMFLMVVLMVAVRWAARSLDLIRRLTLFYVLVVGNLIGLYGLAQFVGYYLGLPVAFFHPTAFPLFRPYGTFIEPNPYANLLSAQLVLSLLLAVSPSFTRWRKWLFGTALLQSFVLSVNQSRAAWIALAVALVGYAVFHFLKYRDLKRPALVFVASLAFFVASLASVSIVNPSRTASDSPQVRATPTASSAAQALTQRVEKTVDPLSDEESTVVWRLRDAKLGLQFWLKRPLTGYGPGTWGTVAYGYPARAGAVPPRNIFVAWLVEHGVVGTLLVVAFYVLLAWRVVRIFRRTRDELYATLLLAHALAVLAVFVNYLSATAEIVPFYWFQVGLLLALTDLLAPMVLSHADRNRNFSAGD